MLKTKKFRRLLAGLLAVLMLSVCLPVGAFADDEKVEVLVSYDAGIVDENGNQQYVGTQNITLDVPFAGSISWMIDEGIITIPDGYSFDTTSDGNVSFGEAGKGTLNVKVIKNQEQEEVKKQVDVLVSYDTGIVDENGNQQYAGTQNITLDVPFAGSISWMIDEGIITIPDGYSFDTTSDGNVYFGEAGKGTLNVKVIMDQPEEPEQPAPEVYYLTVVRTADNKEVGHIQVGPNDNIVDALNAQSVFILQGYEDKEITGYAYSDGASVGESDTVASVKDKLNGNELTVYAKIGNKVTDTPTDAANITIERPGYSDIVVKIEKGTNLLQALNSSEIRSLVLKELPEGTMVSGYTYADPEASEIPNTVIVGGDFTVRAKLVEGFTVTIERVDTEGNVIASNVLAWAEPGEDLLQVLNMAKIDVTAGLPEGSEVVAFTYADPEESTITNVQVYGNLTVRAHISVPVDAHTVTVKRDGYSDVIFTVADGTNLHDFLWKSETQTAVLEGMPDGIGSIVDYTFDRDTGNVIDDYYVVDGDVTVRAIFPVQTHTVTILRGNFDAVQITVDNGTNLYDALWSENVQDVVLAGMPGDYSIMGYTYRAGGDDVAPTDIVLADVTVRVAFESLNTPVTHTVTVKRDGLDDVVLTVEDGANLLKALWDDATQKAVKQGMPESSSITGYTWDREIGNVIDSYYKVETDVTVRAYFSTATYAVTIEREGFDDVIINVERDTKLLEALNDESVKSVILAGLPESYAIDGFTYRDGSEIIDQDIVLADVTVKAVLNQYYTVTIERSNGAPSILVAVKRGDKLLETLNSDDTMAKVMDGCDGYKVTSFTYRDGSEIIDQDIVLVNMTVRANMEAVPAEPSDPSTGDNTTTVTGKDEHPDIAEAKANGTWGAAPTAAPVAAATNTIPQTSDDMPVTMLIVIALVAAGAAGGLVVLRKRSHQ